MIDMWRTHELVGYVGLSTLVGLSFWYRYGLAAALFAAYFLVSGFWIFQNPTGVWGMLQLGVDADAAKATAMFALFLLGVGFATELSVIFLFRVCEIVLVLDAVLVLVRGAGIFNANSMDATAIAMVIPVLVGRSTKRGLLFFPSLILCIAAIISAGGTTAWIVLACGIGAAGWQSRARFRWLFTTAALLFIGWLFLPKDYLNLWDRVPKWKLLMSWWYDNANRFFGTGPGTFEFLGLQVQHTHQNIFVWMHNEYLQTLFDLGVIGLSLGLFVWVTALYRSRKIPWLFGFLVATSIAGITQFPLRFFTTQLLIALCLRKALENERFRVQASETPKPDFPPLTSV